MESGKYCDIADNFKHGKNFKCGSFVKIEKDVIVGDDVTIENYVLLKSGARIGNNVKIEEYAMMLLGSKIGSGAKIGTYAKVGEGAIIGDNCQFTSFCEIRNKCKLGNNVAMGSRGTLSANTVVEDTPDLSKGKEKKVGILKRGSMFGTNVSIMPGVNIGENAEIGACSQVRHDVPDNEIWYGNPARFYKKRGL